MNQPIIIVSGSKGGVGKSLTTMALLEYSSVNLKYLKLIDADTNNPDVWRCYGRLAYRLSRKPCHLIKSIMTAMAVN